MCRPSLTIEGMLVLDMRGLGAGISTILAGRSAGIVSIAFCLSLENITACCEEVGGIDRLAVNQDLVVEMRAGAAAGGPHQAELGPDLDLLAFHGRDALHVRVARA